MTMNADAKIRRLEAQVAELLRRIEEVEDPDDMGFGAGESEREYHGAAPSPLPATEIPPAVGAGALGTKTGTYALEDHTHDSDTEPTIQGYGIITYPEYVLGKKETATPGVYEIGWVEVTDCEGGSS